MFRVLVVVFELWECTDMGLKVADELFQVGGFIKFYIGLLAIGRHTVPSTFSTLTYHPSFLLLSGIIERV